MSWYLLKHIYQFREKNAQTVHIRSLLSLYNKANHQRGALSIFLWHTTESVEK